MTLLVMAFGASCSLWFSGPWAVSSFGRLSFNFDQFVQFFVGFMEFVVYAALGGSVAQSMVEGTIVMLMAHGHRHWLSLGNACAVSMALVVMEGGCFRHHIYTSLSFHDQVKLHSYIRVWALFAQMRIRYAHIWHSCNTWTVCVQCVQCGCVQFSAGLP